MSKQNLTLSLDQEIVSKLKEENNYSEVVNEQMKAFYSVKSCQNIQILSLELAKTKQILKENRKKRKELEQTIDKINKKQKLFKKNLLSRSKMIEEIINRRQREQTSTRRIRYFETPEQEADRILRGGRTI